MKVIEKTVFEIAGTRLELSPLAAGGLMQILARDADQKKRRYVEGCRTSVEIEKSARVLK